MAESLALALVALVVAACDAEPPAPRRTVARVSGDWPTDEWPRAAPGSQGFDSAKLMDALEDARDTGAFHSLFVARNGFEVVDAHAYPYDGSTYHDLASVTKSVLTTLVGIAVTQGELDLDASINSFFPNREIADRSRAIVLAGNRGRSEMTFGRTVRRNSERGLVILLIDA